MTTLKVVALVAFSLTVTLTGLAAAQPVLQSPIVGTPGEDRVRLVEIDARGVEHLRGQHAEVTLADFPMPGGRSVNLALTPFDVLTPDGAVVLGTTEGDLKIGRPNVSLFRGHIAGEPDSRVFLSFSPFGTHGLILSDGATSVLSSGAFGSGSPMVIADLADFPEPPEFAQGWECHVGPEHVNPLGLDIEAIRRDGNAGPRSNPCRIARIAIEGDYEYAAWLFDGDVDAAAAYSVTLIGAVSEIYTRDFNVRLLIPFIRLWEDEADPYDGDKLSQFRTEWNSNMGHVERELAHLLSGNYGGGVAWLSVLCHSSYGYGLSGVSGGFPYPLRDHDHGNWDLMVVGHELGHNFGTHHTHQQDWYDPTIDDCGNGDCSDAWGGTIMSYCHTCSGGMSNIVLGFHPRVIARVSQYLDGACNILGENRAFAFDDEATALRDTPLLVDVLANDIPENCVEPTIFAVAPSTDEGGHVSISLGSGEGGRDEVLYSPPAGYVGADRATYMIETTDGVFDTGEIVFDVWPARPADAPAATRPGARVRYFELETGVSQLPDFGTLEPYAFDILPAINFPYANGEFATSGRISYVGAVFETGIDVPQPGVYTLYLNSDEGSRLLVDGQVVVDNDGIHGMTEMSGEIGLEAGLHLLRIEYFERFGSQGLIASIEGPGMPKQTVPDSMWRTADCIGDWLPDGVVNTIDFIAFLSSWSEQSPAADLDENGNVNTADFILFLGEWAQGCS